MDANQTIGRQTGRQVKETPELRAAGARFGDRGTHTSRTMMLTELGDVLGGVPPRAPRDEYVAAVVQENILGKDTAATRTLSLQRLSELHGFDPAIATFRVLRRLWVQDTPGRPLLALLSALARDPLLRATAGAVLGLPPGSELGRATFLHQLRQAVGDRLNPAILDKVARNAGSTWTQSGHLAGRMRKLRQRVNPTPHAVAFALWLGHLEGRAGEDLLRSFWMWIFDRTEAGLLDLTLQAKQLGLVEARTGGGVLEIEARGVDPREGGR